MDIGGGEQGSEHWPWAAGVNGNVTAVGEGTDLEGVLASVVQGDIACDGGNAEDIEFCGMGEGEENCDRIIHARIAVDNNRTSHDVSQKAGEGSFLA